MSATKILVIEDDLYTREMIERALNQDATLEQLQIEVIQAGDGEEGVELFRRHRPALVVTDLLMPKVDGFLAIEQIRDDPAGRECPILVISGVYRDPVILDKLKQEHGVHVQPKPFLPQVLAKRVHQLLKTQAAPPRQEGLAAGAEGSLAEQAVPRLLLKALEEQVSGTLDLRRGKVRKVVHLMSGHPIFVQSNLRGETLGRMLVRRGVLSSDQHQSALAISKQRGIKYGEALVRLGYLSEGEVMDELREQTRLKIEACLRWQDGLWSFTADPDLGNKVPRCTVDPVELVLCGMQRSSDPEDAFMRVAEKSSEGIRLSPQFATYRERFCELFGSELVGALAPGRSVGEVIEAVGSVADGVMQLDILMRTGLAELESLPRTPSSPVVPPTPARVPLEALPVPEPALAEEPPEAWEESSAVVRMPLEARPIARAVRHKRGSEEVRVALQLIQSIYLGLHDSNHYEVLGLTPGADVDRIEVAYTVKRKQLDLANFSDMDLGEHYAHLEEICAALDRAFSVLSDPEKRAVYDESLGPSATQTFRASAFSAEALCRQGEELFNKGEYRAAADTFAQAVEIDEQPEYLAKHALAEFLGELEAGRDPQEAATEAMLEVQQALIDNPEEITAHLVSAAISREIGNSLEALQTLQELLKIHPACREALGEAEDLLEETGSTQELELLYRRVIHLLGDRDVEWSAALWRRLALLYGDKLKDADKFRTACKVALRLNPGDTQLRALLAEMDHGHPDRWPEAVLGYRSLLRGAPDQPAPIHKLFRLHHEAKRVDAAYIAACAAELRGAATGEEQRFLEEHKPSFLRRAVRPLDPQLMASLRHSNDEPLLSELFQILAPIVEKHHPLSAADLDVKEVDLLGEELPELFSSVLLYISRNLAVPPPAVAVRSDLDADVQGAGSDPPLLLVGPAALESGDRFALCFRVARAVSLLAPGRREVVWRSRRVLRSYILAAIDVTFPGLAVPDSDGEVDRINDALRTGVDLQALKTTITRLRERIETLNITDWQRGIQRTADRVGLLFCTDLVTAGRIMASQDADAEADLVDFALGETYGDLRKSLGLALG